MHSNTGLSICANSVPVANDAGLSRAGSRNAGRSDAQAAGRGGIFSGNVDSPLTIGIATFMGGELLQNEGAGSDESGVYATVGLGLGGAYTSQA